MVAESLATLVADQRLGLSGFKLVNLGLGIVFVFFVFFFGGFSFLDLLQGLVLVVFKPLQGSLDWCELGWRCEVGVWKRILTAATFLDGNFDSGLVKAHFKERFQIGRHFGGSEDGTCVVCRCGVYV